MTAPDTAASDFTVCRAGTCGWYVKAGDKIIAAFSTAAELAMWVEATCRQYDPSPQLTHHDDGPEPAHHGRQRWPRLLGGSS